MLGMFLWWSTRCRLPLGIEGDSAGRCSARTPVAGCLQKRKTRLPRDIQTRPGFNGYELRFCELAVLRRPDESGGLGRGTREAMIGVWGLQRINADHLSVRW